MAYRNIIVFFLTLTLGLAIGFAEFGNLNSAVEAPMPPAAAAVRATEGEVGSCVYAHIGGADYYSYACSVLKNHSCPEPDVGYRLVSSNCDEHAAN